MTLDPAELGMQPHPEGGWYRETWRHDQHVDTPHGRRHLTTCVAFLLQPGETSAWHRVRSAELWLWQGGGPVVVTTGGTGSAPGERVEHELHVGGQHLVRPDEWQTARPAGDEATLVACVVSPGFRLRRLHPPRQLGHPVTETWQTDRPFGPESDDPRGGAEYVALHAAHRLLNDRLAGAAMPPDVEREVTARLDELNTLLAGHSAPSEHDRFDGMRPDVPGRGHPLLPPFVIDEETRGTDGTDTEGTGTLRGRVTFSRFHLGGGAAVHGGVQPLLFDDVLGRVANYGKPFVARTAYLKIDYRHVTLLDVELFWTATLERTDGRKRFATGRLTDADCTVLVDVEALFVELRPGQP